MGLGGKVEGHGDVLGVKVAEDVKVLGGDDVEEFKAHAVAKDGKVVALVVGLDGEVVEVLA